MPAPRLAVITGASTGIGAELARIAADDGYDVVVVADEPALQDTADGLRSVGVGVQAVVADLATADGVAQLVEVIGGRDVDVLCANAGRGLGGRFVEQSPVEWLRVLDTNVTGTLLLLHSVLPRMVLRGHGRILVTGSIAGFMPGSHSAVYNATKAFLDSFTDALRDELREVEGVTVTTLMPGPTDTEFFDRAGLTGTTIDESGKSDPAQVARAGWSALMDGDTTEVPGVKAKVMSASSKVLPDRVVAATHRKMNEPTGD